MPFARSPSSAPGADPTAVLVAVDLQVDFLPGGRLPVPRGDEVLGVANRVAASFRNVVLTQDWHPEGHISFASAHVGRAPFDTIDLPYGPQVLWPDHCTQDSMGARLSAHVDMPHAQCVIRKGHHRHIDSYSTFYEADRLTPTGLTGYLRERGIEKVYLLGLATDFCVAWSAVDGARHGFSVHVVEDACRAIDTGGSLAKAHADMAAAGVVRVTSDSLIG